MLDLIIYDSVSKDYTLDTKTCGGSEHSTIRLAKALIARGYSVELMHVDSANRICECHTLLIQRYSPFPKWIKASHTVVYVHDMPGTVHDHLKSFQGPIVANSMFLRDRYIDLLVPYASTAFPVIPGMLPDEVYTSTRPPREFGRYLYAAARLKGWEATYDQWCHYRQKGDVLHVLDCAYAGGGEKVVVNDPTVVLLPPLTDAELIDEICRASGIFYVNTFPENFPAVIAMADALGTPMYVWASRESGLHELLGCTQPRSNLPHHLTPDIKFLDRRDYRISTILPKWIEVLQLPDRVVKESAPSVGPNEVLRMSQAPFMDRAARLFEARRDAPEIAMKVDGEGGAVPQKSRHDEITSSETHTPIIVAVMIAHDSKTTAHAIRSVLPIVDKVLIIDTGITDHDALNRELLPITPLLVNHFKWTNDFSAARNFALREAGHHGDWALIIDTDEWVNSSITRDELKTRLADTDDHCVLTPHEDGSYHKVRLIRLPIKYQFTGRVHEVYPSGHTTWNDLSFSEHAKTTEQLQAKFTRDREILEEEVRRDHNDQRSQYYLADTYANLGLDDLACRHFERAGYCQTGWDQERAWAWYRAAEIYLRTARPRVALEACRQGMSAHPGIAELAWLASYSCYHLGLLEHGIAYGHAAVALGEFRGCYHSLGRISFRNVDALWDLPFDSLKHLYLKKGDQEMADECEGLRLEAVREKEAGDDRSEGDGDAGSRHDQAPTVGGEDAPVGWGYAETASVGFVWGCAECGWKDRLREARPGDSCPKCRTSALTRVFQG